MALLVYAAGPAPQEITYYFDDYNIGEAWLVTPEEMVDGNTNTNAFVNGVDATQNLTSNTSSDQGGTISKVEIRANGNMVSSPIGLYLRPVFGGTSDGDNHDLAPDFISGDNDWSSWFDITEDTNAPGTWSWTDVANLDCDIEFLHNGANGPGDFASCNKVEIRVTY